MPVERLSVAIMGLLKGSVDVEFMLSGRSMYVVLESLPCRTNTLHLTGWLFVTELPLEMLKVVLTANSQ
jgi:hypothetical protein